MKIGSKIEKKLLHYTGKAIADYRMIQTGDTVMVCVSGGKDSLTLLYLLRLLQMRTNNKFQLFAFTLNQVQPNWEEDVLRDWFNEIKIPYEIIKEDTYSIVTEKLPPGKTCCSLCSRLRRGIIYRYAKKKDVSKIALGHHRDDLIETLLMSIFYNGQIKSMPPKLLTDDKKNIVIRPLAYCQESDIIGYAKEKGFPTVSCGLCGTQKNLMRNKVKLLIRDLACENAKVPSNILHALQAIQPSQLMDHRFWDFKNLEDSLQSGLEERVERYFHGKEKYNCAQAILKIYQQELGYSQEKIDLFKAFGSGRAEEGRCGALFAAHYIMNLQDDEKDSIDTSFSECAGSIKCKEIRQMKRLSCKECVKLAVNLIELNKKC